MAQLESTPTWRETWDPNKLDENQWAFLIDWLTLEKNINNINIWREAINTFRNNKPIYILTTRYNHGPFFLASKQAKYNAEIGGYGEAGPCFNPNTDNQTIRNKSKFLSKSRDAVDQQERDARWLIVWQRIASIAARTGGKAIQLKYGNEKLTSTQKVEEDIAHRSGLTIYRQHIDHPARKSNFSSLKGKAVAIPPPPYRFEEHLQNCNKLTRMTQIPELLLPGRQELQTLLIYDDV